MHSQLYSEFKVVGALTAKTYAFKSRPWELRSTETLDLFDAMGSNIRVDVRDLQIVRVLPRLNTDLNEDWVTDKARFFFDALYKQRCLRGRISLNDFRSLEADGLFLQHYVRDLFLSNQVCSVKFVAGFFNSIDTLCRHKVLGNLVLNNRLVLGTQAGISRNGLDFRTNYVFSNKLAHIESHKGLLLFGVALRYEAPLLALRIRRAVKETGLRVFYLGTYSDVFTGGLRLGSTVAGLAAFFQGRSVIVQLFSTLVSKGTIGCMLGTGFQSALLAAGMDITSLRQKFRKLERSLLPVGALFSFYNMSNRSSVPGAYDLGIGVSEDCAFDKETVVQSGLRPRTVEVIGGFEAANCASDSDLRITMGSHWNETFNFGRFDIVLPDLAPYETAGFYSNLEGRYQMTRKVLDIPGNHLNFDIFSRAVASYDNPNVAFRAVLLAGWNSMSVDASFAAYFPLEKVGEFGIPLVHTTRFMQRSFFDFPVLHAFFPWLNILGSFTETFVVKNAFDVSLSDPKDVLANSKYVAEGLTFYKSDFLTSASYTLMLGYQRFSYGATPYKKDLIVG